MDDPYEFSLDQPETEAEVRSRLGEEKKAFLRTKQLKRKNPATAPPRASYKSKRKETVVNKRKLKMCPICLKENKQLTRHIKRVHSDVSGVVLLEACNMAKVRQPDQGAQKTTCPVCGTMRRNLRSHLIRAHKISTRDHNKVLKELQSTPEVSSARRASNASVAQWMKDYEQTHFNQLDGARMSSKEPTRRKQTRQKVAAVTHMLDFLVTRTKVCSIEGALKVVKQLFVRPDGYVWNRTGKYGTLLHELDYFKEFCAYARREGLADPLVVSTAIERITLARKNLKSKHQKEYAAFQVEDGKKVLRQSDITAFRRSPKARKAMADLQDKGLLSKNDAVNARNFVITTMLLENNSRPSDLEGLTLADLDSAKKNPRVGDDGVKYYSVCSTTSKNVSASGLPTYILITLETMAVLQNYLERARNILANVSSRDAVFVKENGEPMTDENISQGYRSIWTAAAKDNPDFQKGLNSRHFRHSANAVAKLCGSKFLRDTVHIGLNHDRQSNEASYNSIVRPAITMNAKREINRLRETEADRFDQLMAGGCDVEGGEPPSKILGQERDSQTSKDDTKTRDEYFPFFSSET